MRGGLGEVRGGDGVGDWIVGGEERWGVFRRRWGKCFAVEVLFYRATYLWVL